MQNILIAGAGIGGLTAALALSRAGANVTILERAPALREGGAGVQLSPNATRILRRFGVLDDLTRSALAPTGIRVRSGRSGRLIAFLPLADAERRWGAPYLVVRRAALQKSLADAVSAMPNVSLHLATSVAGFGVDGSLVKAVVRQNQVTRSFDGDALIAADGIRSGIRARLVPGSDEMAGGGVAWRALVEADHFDRSFDSVETNLWLGRNAHLIHYPVENGRQINVVAIVSEPAGTASRQWSARGDASAILRRFGGWHGTVRDLLAAAPSWTTWPLIERRPLPALNAGRVALLGDAAHPILPFLAQGAAQAIEDAAALSDALAATPDPARALAAYSRSRLGRVSQVQHASRSLGQIYHLGGTAALARDLTMQALGGRRLMQRYDWLYEA